jgi:hypothetical protein
MSVLGAILLVLAGLAIMGSGRPPVALVCRCRSLQTLASGLVSPRLVARLDMNKVWN